MHCRRSPARWHSLSSLIQLPSLRREQQKMQKMMNCIFSIIGFEEACCGLGPFKATMGCFSKEMVCRTPEKHVWWDLYSPTEAVDALVANGSWCGAAGLRLRHEQYLHPISLMKQ